MGWVGMIYATCVVESLSMRTTAIRRRVVFRSRFFASSTYDL